MLGKVLTKGGNNYSLPSWHYERSSTDKTAYSSLKTNITDALNKNFAPDSNTTFDIIPNEHHPIEMKITMYGDNTGKFNFPGWTFSYFGFSNVTLKGADNTTKEELDVTNLMEHIIINRLSKELTRDLITNFIENGIIGLPAPGTASTPAPAIAQVGVIPAPTPASTPAATPAATPAPAPAPTQALVGGLPGPALPAGDYLFDLTGLGFPYLLPFDRKLNELKDKRKQLEFSLIMDDKHFDLALAKMMLLRTDYENFNNLSDNSKRNNHTKALLLLGFLVKQNEGVDLAKLFLTSKK